MASGGWEWSRFYRDQELCSEGRREDQRAIGSYVRCSIPACARMVLSHELREHAIWGHLPQSFFFGTPTQVSTAVAILANAMVGHGGMRGYTVSCVRGYTISCVRGYTISCVPSTSSRRTISFIRRRSASLDQWPGTGGDECPEHFSLYSLNSVALVTHSIAHKHCTYTRKEKRTRQFVPF